MGDDHRSIRSAVEVVIPNRPRLFDLDTTRNAEQEARSSASARASPAAPILPRVFKRIKALFQRAIYSAGSQETSSSSDQCRCGLRALGIAQHFSHIRPSIDHLKRVSSSSKP